MEPEYAEVGAVSVLLDADGEYTPVEGLALEIGYPKVGMASVAVLLGPDD